MTLMVHPSGAGSRGHLLPVHEHGERVVCQHDCHVILPLRGEPPHGEVSNDHCHPYASPGHTTIGSGLGRLGCGNAQTWLGQSGPNK